MKDKKLKSLEELKCLLPEEDQEQFRQDNDYKRFVIQNWPYMLRTERRLLPLLPKWMKNKLTIATELFDHCNTGMGNDLIWNHTFTLPLNEEHEITFSMLDNRNVPQNLKKYVDMAVEVYKDLQVVYARYGHPLTIVSLQTDDFGMYLPESFYEPTTGAGISERTFSAYCSIKDAIEQIIAPRYSRMTLAREFVDNANIDLDNEQDKIRLNTWFAYQDKKLNDCQDRMVSALASSPHDYYSQQMLECIDVYMGKGRFWGREFCIKWNLDDNVNLLKKMDELRPLINDIIKKTRCAGFAFGVKRKGATVIPCDPVNAR